MHKPSCWRAQVRSDSQQLALPAGVVRAARVRATAPAAGVWSGGCPALGCAAAGRRAAEGATRCALRTASRLWPWLDAAKGAAALRAWGATVLEGAAPCAALCLH